MSGHGRYKTQRDSQVQYQDHMRQLVKKDKRIAELEAELQALRELVKSAYEEGKHDQKYIVAANIKPDIAIHSWNISETKAALEAGND